MNTTLATRNASVQDLAALLQEQHARKLDVVAPAAAIRAESGRLVLSGTGAQLTDDGVIATDGVYVPTEVLDEGLAAKLAIPAGYLRRLRQQRPDLYDANVNGWLHDPDESRSFLVRCFRGDGDGPGIARAVMSDRYGIIDNLDVLMAALDGVRRAGVDVNIDGCDLTERRMYVRVVAPQIAAFAPDLLAGYRSPWGGQDVGNGWTPDRVARAAQREGQAYAGDEPIVFAGFEFTNSEVGNGRFTITPRLTVQICGNGLTITADALSKVHVGARLDEGVIKWSRDTELRALDLVTAQTRDAVEHYLTPDYVKAKVTEIEAKAAAPVTDTVKTVELVAKTLSFTPEQQSTILDHFIRGGQLTAGGIMQAVTSAAQTITDADVAHTMEAAGLRALEIAASGR